MDRLLYNKYKMQIFSLSKTLGNRIFWTESKKKLFLGWFQEDDIFLVQTCVEQVHIIWCEGSKLQVNKRFHIIITFTKSKVVKP